MPSEPSDDLGSRIAKAQAEREAKAARKRRSDAADAGTVSAGAYALRFGIEIVASVFVGGFIGYWIDHFSGTEPWGLLVMIGFGFAAAIRSTMKAYRELNARAARILSGPAQDNGTDR